MLYQKQATSVEDQIAALIARGLDIPDAEKAKRHLRAIGYYRLSAYWYVYEDLPAAGQTRSRSFSRGTTWDDVIALYSLDRRLRMIVMEAIERLEVAVRASWANRFSLESGSHAHLDAHLFDDPLVHLKRVGRMGELASKSNEKFIQHYRDKYSQPCSPPIWAACELMTMGDLSKLYSKTKSGKVKGLVAKDLGLPNKQALESVLQVVSLVRNICAHHSRLWNRRTVKTLPILKSMRPDLHIVGGKVENKIYNVLAVLITLLRLQGDVSDWHRGLYNLVANATPEQRTYMGFPNDWASRACWKTTDGHLMQPPALKRALPPLRRWIDRLRAR